MSHATIKHVFLDTINAPAVFGSLTPADFCQHNHIKYLCVFCRKWADASKPVACATTTVPATDSKTPQTASSDKK